MRQLYSICFVLTVVLVPFNHLLSQTFSLGFSEADVNCGGATVCYDVNLAADATTFDLGSYNLRLFYDQSRINYLNGSINTNSLPSSYSIGNVQDQSGDLSGLGSQPFEMTLGFLEIGVDYTPSTAASISGTNTTILQNLCFSITDSDILNDPASCFDLIWVNDDSNERYTNSVTTINNASNGTTTDLSNSTYINLTSANNCISSACMADPCNPIVDADNDGVCDVGANPDIDPNDPCRPNPSSPACISDEFAFELSFVGGAVDCDTDQICYNVAISSPESFSLGAYNLRMFYDNDILDLVDASPNLNPGSALASSYSIQVISDTNQGDQSANGGLSFDDNLGFIDVGVDINAAGAPINVAQVSSIILYDLCFDVVDPAALNEPSICPDLIWVNEITNENYTGALTTVNVESNNGQTTDLSNSTYNNLTSNDANCLTVACNPITFELDFTDADVDCNAGEICYNVTMSAPEDFLLGSYNLRLYYDGDVIDAVDASPNTAGDAALAANYTIGSINDMQGGDMSGNGSLSFDDNLDIIDIAIDYFGGSAELITSTPRVVTYDLCFTVVDSDLISEPAVCLEAVWVTNATEENYTVGETTVNVANTIGVTTDIDNSIYNGLEPSGENCAFSVCQKCPAIACNDRVQISLDNMCQGVTLDMLLEGGFVGSATIQITGADGKVVTASANMLDGVFLDKDGVELDWSAYVGDLISYKIISDCDGNSCWGEALIEIKRVPVLDSPCKITRGENIIKEIKFSDLATADVVVPYTVKDVCQLPIQVTTSDAILYSCALGDDGVAGTSDDGWCTSSCVFTDDGTAVTVSLQASAGDPTGALIPAGKTCTVSIKVPDCAPCIAWCSEEGSRSYPDGFITLDDIKKMTDEGCFADIVGDIDVVENVEGDACESLTEVSYYARVNIYGEVSKTLILEQAFKTVPLNPLKVRAPLSPVEIDCGKVSQTATPAEIFAVTGSGSLAFPFFSDEHTQVPVTVEICGLDHYQVATDTTEQAVAIEVDENKDGVTDGTVWVLLPVVNKVVKDSLVCEVVKIATDGNIIVNDAKGKCLGDGTAYVLKNAKGDPVKITKPAAFTGNSASYPGSTTCDMQTDDAIVHIEDPKYCNLIVSYSDAGPFEACGSGYKIIRSWLVLDWCDSRAKGIELGNQFIEIIDTEAPEFEPIADDAVSIDPWVCSAKYPLNLPDVKDGCDGSEIDFDIQVSQGRYDKASGFIVDLFPTKDSIEIIIKIKDDCQNEARDTFNLRVFDGVAPVPVCHDNLVVSLTTGGVAKIFADDFDAGSHDAGCGDVEILVARMAGCCDDECAGGDKVCMKFDKFGECIEEGISPESDEFGEFVKFCCDDAGKTVMVAVLVIDPSGNRNTCMMEVTVVDKSTVALNCEDVTISCLDDLSKVGPASPIAAVCEGGSADLLDEEYSDNGCGTGIMTRTWWIDRDGSGDASPGDPTCKQRITIVSDESSQFDPRTIKWPRHYTGEIYTGVNLECGAPEEVEVKDEYGKVIGLDTVITVKTIENHEVKMGDVLSCSSTDIGDAPVWCNSPCGLVGYSVEEEEVIASDACKKVIKRWTVIDWCIWDANGPSPQDDANDTNADAFEAVEDWAQGECAGCDTDLLADAVYFRYDKVDRDGYYTYDQVIKVVDDSDPTITVDAEYKQLISGGATSKDDDTTCQGSGTVTASAQDQCGGIDSASEFLRWEITRMENGVVAARKNHVGATAEMGTGEGGPGDTYTIIWEVSDGCGNAARSETEVTFGDDKAPTPLCISGVTTAFMQETGTVTIWAKDFDLGSFDNCTDVIFSMVPSGEEAIQPGAEGFDAQGNYTFNCTDVANFADFDVWVWDANGLGDFCTVGVLVGGTCNQEDTPAEGASGQLISGTILTELGEAVDNTNVSISASLAEYPKSMTTSSDGQYSFNSNPMGNQYRIQAERNDNIINGVSTIDIVLIQKHILNLDQLSSPYQMIAADINNSRSITASDLVSLRKAILGVIEEFPNNKSWRFSAADFALNVNQSPWPFMEEINVFSNGQDMDQEDFIAIKVGDVNQSATPNRLSRAETRSLSTLRFTAEERMVNEGEIITVPIRSTDFVDVAGFQSTLRFADLKYVSVESGAIEMTEENVAVFANEELTMSWNDAGMISTDEVLFTLTFEALSSTLLSESLEFNADRIVSEIYTGDDLEQANLEISILNADAAAALFQNDPNPFVDETTIRFTLADAEENVSFLITDVSGKQVQHMQADFAKGENSLTISAKKLGLQDGVYYYTMTSNAGSITRKMVILNN